MRKVLHVTRLLLLLGSNFICAEVRPLLLQYKVMHVLYRSLEGLVSREVSRPPVTEVGARLVKW